MDGSEIQALEVDDGATSKSPFLRISRSELVTNARLDLSFSIQYIDDYPTPMNPKMTLENVQVKSIESKPP